VNEDRGIYVESGLCGSFETIARSPTPVRVKLEGPRIGRHRLAGLHNRMTEQTVDGIGDSDAGICTFSE
jgi:hypothetical protein